MRSHTTLIPGEVQGCTGCHADRNTITTRNPGPRAAFLREPQHLTPPEWGIGGFSYPSVVQPVWDKYCAECHNAREAPGGVDLSGDKTDLFCVSYDVLARKGTIGERTVHVGGTRESKDGVGRNPYTSWIPTYNDEEANILKIAPRTWGSPASRLTEIILSGHPDKQGKPRLDMDQSSRRRIMTSIDLNVPYYHTSESNHYDRKGGRRIIPEDLDEVLHGVATRRCASCHKEGTVAAGYCHRYEEEAKKAERCASCHQQNLPRKFYTRILQPENNNFLLAPLAKSSGGTEACGRPVFESKHDPDYQAILATFKPVEELLEKRPRMDMTATPCECTVPKP